MAHFWGPKIGNAFSEYFYKTEYQRSFADKMRRSEPSSRISPVSHQNTKDINNRYHSNATSKQPISLSKSSIGIQTDEKKVKFDMKPSVIQQREAFQRSDVENDERRRQNNDCTMPDKGYVRDNIDNTKYAPERVTDPSGKSDREISPLTCNKPIKPQKSYSDTDLVMHSRYIPYHLNLVAGNDSTAYQRAPFIQSKKKALYPTTRSPSEPALQKKKIIPYNRNHNIMRTTPSDENLKNGHELLLNDSYDDHSTNMYKSSYDLEFKRFPLDVSPIALADSRFSSPKDRSTRRHYDIRNSLSYSSGKYDKSNYETEYHRQFSPKRSKSYTLISTSMEDDDFSDYFQEVMNNREIAYKPFLAWAKDDETQQKTTEANRNNYDDDVRDVRRVVSDDDHYSPSQQQFRNGRYTRTYRAENYT